MSGAPGTLRRLLHRQRRALENLPANLRRELALRRFAARERPQLLEARRRHEADHLKCDLPLVSIVINTYCRGPLLAERTLPSILAQTHQNFEIVIVGDCCIASSCHTECSIVSPSRVERYVVYA